MRKTSQHDRSEGASLAGRTRRPPLPTLTFIGLSEGGGGGHWQIPKRQWNPSLSG